MIKKRLSCVFYIIYAIIFTGTLLSEYHNFAKCDYTYIVVLSFAVAALGIAGYKFVLTKVAQKLDNKKLNIIYLCVALFILVVQLLMVFKLNTVSINDRFIVETASTSFAKTGDWTTIYQDLTGPDTYFDRYVNNWAILIFTGWFYRIWYLITGDIPYYAHMIINVIFLQTAYFFYYKISKMIFKDIAKVLASLVLLICCAGLYMYTTIVYTDTLSMPFVMGAIYFTLRIVKAQSKKAIAVNAIIASLIIAVGYSIKGSVGIILVAAAIYLFFNTNWKRALASTAAFVIAFVLVNNVIIYQYGLHCGISSKEDIEMKRYPSTHWVMMGLVGRGGFDFQSTLYTSSFPNYEAKKEANIKHIKEILSDPDYSFIDHIYFKSIYIWTDGRYDSAVYLKNSNPGALRDFVCGKYSITRYYAWLYNLTMMLLMLVSLFTGIKNKETDGKMFIKVAAFGLLIFLYVWEARSRYLVNFVPVHLLIMTDAITNFTSLFTKKKAAEIKVNEASEPESTDIEPQAQTE